MLPRHWERYIQLDGIRKETLEQSEISDVIVLMVIRSLLRKVVVQLLLNNFMTVDRLRFLSTQAKTDLYVYIHDEIVYNYRMTNL